MARTELPAATAGQATEPPLLAATGLGFAAGGRPILGGIDFSLASGALRVLIGPNGAGKSVLLRLLHGLLPPGDGVVLWRGRPLDRTARRRQAMVFQRPVMLRRSVAANMAHALAAAGVRRRERAARLDEALALADLKPLAARPARVLSGGEQQRVALARALSLRPELLFLDEPTASLDPASTLAIETLVLAAHRAGTTVLMVTHDLGQARRLGGEIVFLDRGGLTAPLPAAEFFAAPPSPAAGAFVEGRLVV